MANSFQYLTPDNVVEMFKSSKQWTDGFTDRFPENERIARNLPHPSVPKELPKTTDGTTASIIRKTPHRIIQQLPTGTVKSDTDDWLSIVAGFIYTHKIIPKANEDYALIQKCWSVVERFLTFGFCATYTPFVEHGGEHTTDLRLPYWGDVFLQPGKTSISSSNYVFLRSWWQTKDIDALIASQSKLSKGTEQTWDTAVLTQIKDMVVNKEDKAKTPAERELNVNTKGGVELITGLQRGVNSKFLTFHVQSEGIARTKVNKDPRGEIPMDFAYGDVDGSNPFGRSIIELVGPLQNLIDSEMQMFQFNRALGLAPPVMIYGINKNKFKYQPNNVTEATDPAAFVKPIAVDTTALVNFPNNYGLMKSQMLNLLASPDTSIGADAGNPGFSKTSQGVQASQANLSVDDNYVRKQFESWFEGWSETAINLYFAERTGVEELQLDDETAEALRGLDVFDQTLLSDDNKIRLNYDTATPALHFEVNASSSQMKNDPAQQQIAGNLLEMVMKYPMLNSNFGGPIDVDELARKIVTASAIEDPEDIAPEPTKEQKAAKAAAKKQPNGFSPMFDKPSIKLDYNELPPSGQIQMAALAGIQLTMQDVLQGPVLDPNARSASVEPVIDPAMLVPGGGGAQQQASPDSQIFGGAPQPQGAPLPPNAPQMAPPPGQAPPPGAPPPPPQAGPPPDQQAPSNLSPEDQQFVAELQQMGIPDEDIGHALAMLHQGVPPEDILKALAAGTMHQGAPHG